MGLRPGFLGFDTALAYPHRAGDPERCEHTRQTNPVITRRTRLGNHRGHLPRQLEPPESFFKTRLPILSSPMTWSRSTSADLSCRISLTCSLSAPRPPSACLPPLCNSSRHRYRVCSEIPARRAICAAGSSLLNNRTTSSLRFSGGNVDFLPISNLLSEHLEYHATSCPEKSEQYNIESLVHGFLNVGLK